MARRPPKKVGDDLDIPAFLRRAPDRTTADRVLRMEEERAWIMPDLSKRTVTSNEEIDVAKKTKDEGGMVNSMLSEGLTLSEDSPLNEDSQKKKPAAKKVAKKAAKPKAKAAKAKPPKTNGPVEVDCQDPALPVEVNFHRDDGKTEVMPFANMQEFIDWYSPSMHILDGSIADDSTTMVEVTEKPRPKAEAKGDKKVIAAAKGKEPTGAVPASPKTSRGAVVKAAGREPGVKKPRGVGFVRHGVRVTAPGAKKPQDFSSLYQAFVGLGLSIPAHTKFRAELKKSKGGKLTYEESGKKYPFELVELKK